MTYEELITTVSAIVGNDKITKDGLILTYELEEKNHKAMNEFLFYKSNPITATIGETDIFEVEIGGITIKFIKKTIE